MFFVASYDVGDDRRRSRLLCFLRGFGRRVQYSVVECPDLAGARAHEMIRMASPFAVESRDSIRFYPLCRACRQSIVVIGPGEVTRVARFYAF